VFGKLDFMAGSILQPATAISRINDILIVNILVRSP